MGRPSLYTPELVEQICEQLAIGTPLAQICRAEGYPAYRTVKDWIDARPEVSAAIARARDAGEETLLGECKEIADDGRNDWMERLDKDGTPIGWMLNGEHVKRSALRIETRLKLLAKWNPKKYGDRTALEHSGPGGTELVVTLRSVLDDPK